jgi:FtsX-like permease family protein
MATIRFVLKRLVAQRLLALAIIVTLAFSIGVLVAGPIYADASREAILSSELHSQDAAARNIRFSVYGPGSFDFQRATADARKAVAGLPVARILTQGLSGIVLKAGGRHTNVPVLFRTGAAGQLGLRGQAPSGLGDIVLSTGTARVLHVHIGSAVTASAGGLSTPLRVTGTYEEPLHRTGVYWFESLNPFPPPDSIQPLPTVMGQAGYLALAKGLDLTTQFAWDVYLSTGSMTFQAARQTASAIQSLTVPRGSPLAGETCLSGPEGTCFTTPPATGFPSILALVDERTANLRVPIYVVVFQIGAVALAVLAGVASLALSRQSFELAVLRSRGFSRRKLLSAQAVQIAVTSVLAYPIGLLIGTALARLATHANGPAPQGTRSTIALSPTALIVGAIAVVAGAAILLLLTIPATSRTIVEERRQLSREARPLLARIPLELFVLPLGIAAFYEVKTRGFLPATQSGSLDPLVVVAPTLLVFAASFLVLRLLLFALRVLERPIGSTRPLGPYLAVRRLGRSPGTSFAISLLLVLSIGLLVVSTTYRATVNRNHEDTAHQEIGADWQIQVGSVTQQLPGVRRLPSNTTAIIRAEPVFESTATRPATALAIDPDTYPSGGWWRSDYSSMSEGAIMSALKVPDPGVELPAGARKLTLSVALPALHQGLPTLEVVAALERPDGSVARVEFGSLRRSRNTFTASTDRGRRLLSIVLAQTGGGSAPHRIDLRLHLVASGRSVPLDLWTPLLWRNSAGSVVPGGQATRVSLTTGLGNVVAGIVPPEQPIPALVSPGLAGTTPPQFNAMLGGQTLTFRTVGEAQAFPSVIGDFMAIPLRTTVLYSERVTEPALAVDEVWAMGPDPRSELRPAGFVPGEETSAARRVAVLSQLPQSLAVGMHYTAAAGGMGLVVIGVAVGLYFTQRRREFEFASLRAMGSGPGQISGVLLMEQGAMTAFAALAGTALGFVVVRLMMPYFGKSLGSNFPPPLMVVDWRSLGLYAAAIAVATGLAVVLSLRALLSSSVISVLRGEAE